MMTPGKIFYQDSVTSLVLPAYEGSMGVLAGHMKMIVQVVPGRLYAEKEGASQAFFVRGGIAKIDADRVVLMCEEIEAIPPA